MTETAQAIATTIANISRNKHNNVIKKKQYLFNQYKKIIWIICRVTVIKINMRLIRRMQVISDKTSLL